MKLYRYLTLMFLLGMVVAAANATATDPGVILRSDGSSQPVGPTFAGAFQAMATDPFVCTSAGLGPGDNCFQNVSTFTFVALTLTFHDPLHPLLTFGCGANSPDPFFSSCSASGNVVTFSGVECVEDSGCGGIPSGVIGGGDVGHFRVGLVNLDGTSDTADTNITYQAVADIGTTPEPASALLFVIGIGVIALFLKRA
jgi:hypothetical protein